MSMAQPVVVLNANTQRESGRKAQLNNIQAAQAVSELIRSTLGPCAMLKMVLDPMGGITLTNDGNSILREIDVVHPSAKHMIELSRVQDDEVGDGTTSVIVLTGELLGLCPALLEDSMHPLTIVRGFYRALHDGLEILRLPDMSETIDLENETKLQELIRTCVGTKVTSRQDMIMSKLAVTSVRCIQKGEKNSASLEVDLKRYVKIEKIPGGSLEDSEVLVGVMFNKDVVHPKMSRRIVNPRILLLDCPLEYKKPETSFNVEITKDTDFELLIRQEEDFIRGLCSKLAAYEPSIVITEKGVSDLAAHFLARAGVSVIRRLRKTDNNRLARACGATIVSSVEDLTDEAVGTQCGLFEVRKIGDEYFSYFEKCENPKACSIVLRGASKDVLNETERNLRDALCVARNVFVTPHVVFGAGALELELSSRLMEKSKSIAGEEQLAYQAVAKALEVIPRTLIQNCGANTIRTLTEVRAKHATPGRGATWGVDGVTGEVSDVRELKVIEPLVVKLQCLKTAVEAACIMLRIDDVVSGIKGKESKSSGPSAPVDEA